MPIYPKVFWKNTNMTSATFVCLLSPITLQPVLHPRTGLEHEAKIEKQLV